MTRLCALMGLALVGVASPAPLRAGAMPALSAQEARAWAAVGVVNETGTELTVPGYTDEPYLRIGPDGVWGNALSPATYLNLDRYGLTRVPDDVDVTAPPRWEQVSTEPAYVNRPRSR